MVLAAGLGTRMRPLTFSVPKPLVQVGGRALVDHMLDRLASMDLDTVVINVHWLADQLEAHVRNRAQQAGMPRLVISDERARLMETGGALVQARGLLGDDPIFVCNTDQTWTDPGAFQRLAGGFDSARHDAVLLLARREHARGYAGRGDFHLAADGTLQRRGSHPNDRADFVYAGAQILDPRLLDGFACEPFSVNKAWDIALARGRLCGVELEGPWLHVGDPEALDDANRFLAGIAA